MTAILRKASLFQQHTWWNEGEKMFAFAQCFQLYRCGIFNLFFQSGSVKHVNYFCFQVEIYNRLCWEMKVVFLYFPDEISQPPHSRGINTCFATDTVLPDHLKTLLHCKKHHNLEANFSGTFHANQHEMDLRVVCL